MVEQLKIEKLLHEYFEVKKKRIYYGTTEIMKMTGISIRTLRYRISQLKQKYVGVKSLLVMRNNKWQIHNDIVHEFLPKYQARNKRIHNLDWQSFITWIPLNNYDDKYHRQLADEVAGMFPNFRFYYVLEQTDKGLNHVHMLSTGRVEELKHGIDVVLSEYIEKNEYRLEVSDVMNKVIAVNYLQKDKRDERLY